MIGQSRTARLAAGLAISALIGACSTAATTVPPPASLPAGTSTAAPSFTSTPGTAVPTTAKPATVHITSNVAYQASDPFLRPELLDVYAPVKAGSWPVVVMFHGSPAGLMTKEDLTVPAIRVANLGFVVFVPTWGRPASGPPESLLTRPGLLASQSQAACAVAFAAAHAPEYGGDSTRLVVFGHSAGANVAAAVAFTRPSPTTGCLGGNTLPSIRALVTWEGDWLTFVDPGWDGLFATDPSIIDVVGILPVISKAPDLKVVMLVADDPGMPDLPVAGLATRDPSGALRKQLKANGALADGQISWVESQQLLFSLLKAQGNPVSLDVMPSSHHDALGDAGWPVYLAAFGKAAQH